MKNKVLKRVVFIVIIIIGSMLFFNGYTVNENLLIVEDKENKIINNEDKENKITNILLLGIDKQENASDTIIILSLNEKNKTIKLVSIMRDTYVYQGENMANKINYAYHYGGTKGSIDTINSIFNLDISKFVKVNFEGLTSIVNNLGGVEVEISESERKIINLNCNNNVLNHAGKVKLNGEQALAFSRIRKIDSDFERTQRQRKVMIGIFQNIKKLKSYQYLNMLYKLNKISETNLSLEEVVKLCDIVYKCDKDRLSELRIPIDGTSWDSSSMPYHLNWDEEVNKKALHEFIYG